VDFPDGDEVSSVVAVLEVGLFQNHQLGLAHYCQHPHMVLAAPHQLHWEGLAVLVRKQPLDLEELVEKGITCGV